MRQLSYWVKGIRLYVAIAALLITIEVAWWADAVFSGTALFAIRVEEIYAWVSVGCLVIALLIGPSYRLFPTLPGKSLMRDARRMIGLSAAWFAAWHVGVAYFSLFKHSSPLDLAPIYQWSFGAGIVALLILLIMSAISFNAAFKSMGIWWFRIQRFVYVAGLLVVLHAVLIGTHASNTWVGFALIMLTLALILLHALVQAKEKKHEKK